MASPIVYTALSSSLSGPSATVLYPGPSSSVVSDVMAGPLAACMAGPDLCPDGTSSPVYVGLGTEGEVPPNMEPPLAPMPFATPASKQLLSSITTTPTILPITTLTSILTHYTPSPSSPPAPTSSLDAMMQGNPMPSPMYLHTTTIIGISIASVLVFPILPLLIFGIVMKYRLQKAKAFQLGQGPRRPLEWGGEGWEETLEERRREWVVDDAFMRGFRRRVEGRAYVGRAWI